MAIIPELARGLCTLLTPSLLAGARDKHGRARQDPKAKRERKRWCTGLTCDISGVTFVPWCGAHLLDSNSARRAGSTPRCCQAAHPPGAAPEPAAPEERQHPGGMSTTRAATDLTPWNPGSFPHPWPLSWEAWMLCTSLLGLLPWVPQKETAQLLLTIKYTKQHWFLPAN